MSGIGLKRLQHLVLWVSNVDRSVRAFRSSCSSVASGSPGTPAVCSPATKSERPAIA